MHGGAFPANIDSSGSEADAGGREVHKGAAMDKMTRLAQKIYDTTPGINDCKSLKQIFAGDLINLNAI